MHLREVGRAPCPADMLERERRSDGVAGGVAPHDFTVSMRVWVMRVRALQKKLMKLMMQAFLRDVKNMVLRLLPFLVIYAIY